jgi:hypothetical protein
MRKFHVVAAFTLVATATFLAGCGGGGGHGYSGSANPILITSNALPNTLSGEQVSYCIPYTGGSGGPYLLEVIDGALPKGVALDSQTVCLTGRALEDGVFNFTLKLTDTGSQPFSTATEVYKWTIGIGSLVFATDATLPPFVYNRFDSVPLVVAGGVPPYACEVVDDPQNAFDELLPTGLAIPPDSCTIVGAPTGVKAGVAPFVYKVSVRARDHADDPYYPNPLWVIKEFTITVLIPDIVIASTSVSDGKCGTTYSDKVEVLDGIPPFLHRIVDGVGSNTVLSGDPQSQAKPSAGLPGPVAKGTATSAYADETVAGPYTGKFPEGIYLRETTGDLIGRPRRSGVFNQWIYWIQSTALPGLASQNKWRAFSFSMSDSVPPSLVLDTSVLQANQTFTPPNNVLGSWEFGITKYVQFAAVNGCPADGYCDAPHEGQRTVAVNEADGQFNFTGSQLVDVAGQPTLAQMGLTLTNTGSFGGTPVLRSGYRTLSIKASDYQLPSPASAAHSATGTCQFEIGPDTIIVTQSTASNNNTTPQTWLPIGTINDVSYEYNSVDVLVWEPFSAGSSVRPLDNTKDLTATHQALPGSTSLSSMLTSVDIMSITVNPTWWAYDGYNLNARSARSMQGGSPQRGLNGASFGADGYTYYPYYNSIYNNYIDTYERQADTCIQLPATSVAHSPSTGVYADGGQMYGFENASYFGVFIIRKDSKIYVPFALAKSAGYEGFGDAVLTSNRTASGIFRRPQITVSPDGKFAAVKLKVDVDNFIETCSNEKVVFFSLTGEKPFAGSTYRITSNTGGSGNTNDGQYMYGSSFALTNKYLYFLKGNNYGTSYYYDCKVMYRDHWVYRVPILSGDPTLLTLAVANTTQWTNSSGSALQMPFQRWAPPNSSSLYGGGTSSWGPTETYSGSNYLSTSGNSVGKSPQDFYGYHWACFSENSAAPMPFRVNAEGTACAMMASPVANASSYGSGNLMWYLFVDYDTAGLRQVSSSTMRRFQPPTRLSGLRPVDTWCRLYGWFTGPATQFEISDDGKSLAAVYNDYTGGWYGDGYGSSTSSGYPYNPGWYNYYNSYTGTARERIYVAVTNSGSATDPWSGYYTREVTSGRFEGGMNWRFGCLAWTRDNAAFVFWGGSSLYGANQFQAAYRSGSTIYGYTSAAYFVGTLYEYTPASDLCESILATADGGSTDAVKTITSSAPAISNTVPSNGSGSQGSILPVGYFITNDGNFMWVETMGALYTSGDTTSQRLVGVNVKSSVPSSSPNTINGRAPLRAFAPTWPAGRGWGMGGAYYPSTGYYQVGPTASWQFCTTRAAARVGTHIGVGGSNGLVYYVSYWQPNGGSYTAAVNDNYLSTSNYSYAYYGGGPANPTSYDDQAKYSAELFAMDTASGNGPVRLTTLGSDSTAYRFITYIRPSWQGKSVAFVTSPHGSPSYATYTAFPDAANEQVYAVTGVAFNSSGALSGTPYTTTVESSTGRAGTSMSFDYSETRLYYAFKAGASNENQMELVEAKLSAGGSGVQGRRTQAGYNTTVARFSVLHSGR